MLQEFAAGAEGLGLSACHDADEEEEEEDDEEEEEADDDDGAGYVDGVAALSVVALRVSELGCPQTLALVHFAASAEDIVEDIGGLVANYNTPPPPSTPRPLLHPAPAAIKLQRCAPLICQKLWTEIQKN